MQNVKCVETLESMQDLYQDIPYFLLLEELLLFLLLYNLLVKVAVVEKLHDDAT